MKDGRPFTLRDSGKTGKTPNLGSGCELARLSQASPMNSSHIKQHHAVWLGETENGNLKKLLVPYPADQMRMWEISPRVNSPKNDAPSLWEPLHSEPIQTTTDELELLPQVGSSFRVSVLLTPSGERRRILLNLVDERRRRRSSQGIQRLVHRVIIK